MAFFDSSKSIVENLYLLSGPIIALLSFFIFRQIKLSKEQLNIQKGQLLETQKQLIISSKREAVKLAVEQIHFFSENIIDDESHLSNEIKLPKIATREFSSSEVFKILTKEQIGETMAKMKPYLIRLLKVTNNLEVFSSYFIRELADESVAYQINGKTFCNMVDRYSFLICIGRAKHKQTYDDIIKLYNCWKDRLETTNLEIQKENIEKEFEQKMEEIKKGTNSN